MAKNNFRIPTVAEQTEELIDKLVREIKIINRRLTAFRKATAKDSRLQEFIDYVDTMVVRYNLPRTKSGNFSTRRSTFRKIYTKRIHFENPIETLAMINNDVNLNTVRAFTRALDRSREKVEDFIVENFLGVNGITMTDIRRMLNDEMFMGILYGTLNELSEGEYFDSGETIERLIYEYKLHNELGSKKQLRKLISDIDYSRQKREELGRINDEFEEWLNAKGMSY